MANRTLVLNLDEEDYATIQQEIAMRQAQDRNLPDGDSNLAGAMLAECIRDLEEYRALYDVEHPAAEA
jgi:hypothetical protein